MHPARTCRRSGSRRSRPIFRLSDLGATDVLLARPMAGPHRIPAHTAGARAARGGRAAIDMPQLTPIEDATSLAVQAQYEANPYPRWVRTAEPRRYASVDAYLGETFPSAPFRASAKSGSLDILIAGCGTGQHAVMTARQYEGARVLAIDLSRASLAYACARTRALGLDSIEYAQADIMRLGALGRSVRSDRVERRAASHGRSLCGMARAAVAAASGRLHAHRALQPDRALGRRRGPRVHRRTRLWFDARPKSGASATT